MPKWEIKSVVKNYTGVWEATLTKKFLTAPTEGIISSFKEKVSATLISDLDKLDVYYPSYDLNLTSLITCIFNAFELASLEVKYVPYNLSIRIYND